jgi:hypothetical protein
MCKNRVARTDSDGKENRKHDVGKSVGKRSRVTVRKERSLA